MTQTTTQLEKQPVAKPVPTDDRPVFLPATDLYEKQDATVIRCDMPGVDEAHLEVTLDHDVLTLTGAQAEAAPEGYELVAGEYSSGVYERAFRISNEIDRAGIKASIRNGVLEVVLPKSKEAQPRRIPVVAQA
jgi:HSP20 family molecular chaperone IbpA